MGSPRLREGHRGHMGVTWGHIGVTGVTGVTWASRCSNGSETGSHGVTGVTWGSLGSHWGHGGHMGVTWGHEGHRGDRPRPLTPDPAGGAVLRAVPGWGGADADAAAVAHDAAAGPGPRAHGGRVPGSDRTRRVLSPAAAAAMGPLPRHDGRPGGRGRGTERHRRRGSDITDRK